MKSLHLLFDLFSGTTLVRDHFQLHSACFELRSFAQGGHSSSGKSKGQKEMIRRLLPFPEFPRLFFFFK